MKFNALFFAIVLVLGATSCATHKKIAYFQDLTPGVSTQEVSLPLEIKIQPDDKISILVNSKNPQLVELFNLPYVARQIGQVESSTPQGVSGYTVDADGNIDFPVLGKIHIAGKSRAEVAAFIKNELISNNLVNDPVVTVEFMNLTVSVMGEVNSPGRYSIDKDKMSILEILSMAGDLTIYGRRDNVLVLRQEEGEQKVYAVNLASAAQLYTSPAYYLQQNDVVYVEPNDTKSRQSTVNGNNVRSTSFWLSLASLLTTIAVLIFN